MITIPLGLDPVALALGPLEVRWYGLFAVLAIAVAYALTRAGAARANLPVALVDDGAIWVGLAALAGGRVLYVLQNELPAVAADPLHLLAVWHGGLSFYGGLVAGLVALAVFTRRRGVGFGLAADLVAPGAAAGQAIGHLGCFIGGDSFGLPTSGPLAVVYSHPAAMAPRGVPLVPTQLYEALGLALIAVALWYGRPLLGRLGTGAVAAAYLLANAGLRFELFFARDDVVVAYGLKVAQLLAIAIALGALAWFATLRRASAAASPSPSDPSGR